MKFNPPPGWPSPPDGWTPPSDWKPDPAWPEPPPGWQLWLPDERSRIADDINSDTPTSPNDGISNEPNWSRAPSHESEKGADLDTSSLLETIKKLELELQQLRLDKYSSSSSSNDDQALLEAGIYQYHHPLEDAQTYKESLSEINSQVQQFIKSGNAVLVSEQFTLDGSLAKGRKMTRDLAKLLLRAYNAEADNCVRSLRKGNASTAKARLERATYSIEKLGALMEMRVNPDYHQVRVTEIELTADFQMKKAEERERAREEREELREQRRVEAELAAERERLHKERSHYLSVIAALKENGDEQALRDFERLLHEIDDAIVKNDYRAANIRAGYIYVISNIGALGRNVVKIGMTRRLEPRDRVRELGDASVPFLYDTHALFFSEDAVSLESELHKIFADRRVNQVNHRREFFFVTPSEVKEVLFDKLGGFLEFNENPEALEYFQSRNSWPDAVVN